MPTWALCDTARRRWSIGLSNTLKPSRRLAKLAFVTTIVTTPSGKAKKGEPRSRKPVTGLEVTESGRRDSNPGPPAPKAGALPDCATPRLSDNNLDAPCRTRKRVVAGGRGVDQDMAGRLEDGRLPERERGEVHVLPS